MASTSSQQNAVQRWSTAHIFQNMCGRGIILVIIPFFHIVELFAPIASFVLRSHHVFHTFHTFTRFTSILTVFVNKALLSGDTELDAPLFITWIQCITSVALCQLLRIMKKSYLPNPNVFSRNTVRQILPLAILFTMMVGMNNLCLKYVAVSFYYIGRSLTTVFNVIFSFVLLRQGSSFRCLLCCATIIFGFWLGVDQESIAGTNETCIGCFSSVQPFYLYSILYLIDIELNASFFLHIHQIHSPCSEQCTVYWAH